MSLSEALLLEGFPTDALRPASPYGEGWIALRGDSRGSGRIDDPYDGSTWRGSILSAALQWSGADPAVCAVSTSPVAHGYQVGDLVTIAGVTGSAADYFNGTFPVSEINAGDPYWFKYAIASAPAGPQGSGITCQQVIYRLDGLLKSMPANSTAHIGPGVFETRGNGNTDWALKNGQRIVGSGMGVTTLKLIVTGIPNPGKGYAAITGNAYNNYVSDFEVCDLTVDCNLSAHPIGNPYSTVAKAAVAVGGSHIRLRRIRAIHFGSQAPGVECFVIATAGAHPALPQPVDCVIEDCIIEHPNPTQSEVVTCLHLQASERDTDGFMAYHRGCAIRNCYVNCAFADGTVDLSFGFQALSADGGTAAVVEGNRIYNCQTGGPYHDTYSTLALVSRQNYFYNCRIGLYLNFGGLTPPNRKGSPFRNVQSIARLTQGGEYFGHAVVSAAHDLEVGDGVVIKDAVPTAYNGSFEVTEISTDHLSFDYKLASDPGGDATTPGQFSRMSQVRFLCDEGNHVNLVPYQASSTVPVGTYMLGDLQGSPYITQNLVIQDAAIDEIQFPVGQVVNPISIAISTVRNMIAIGNVSGLVFPATGERGLHYRDCQSITMFGNRGFDGRPMPIFNDAPPKLIIDVDAFSTIEEATILALM